MSEELENKLNELMGLKKRLESISEEQMKAATESATAQYKSKTRLVSMFFVGRYLIGLGLIILGFVELTYDPAAINVDAELCIIVGLFILLVGKLFWLISDSKLATLRAIKESELRITEMLKK